MNKENLLQPSSASQANIRALTRGAYDLQKLRIQTGNRITANFRAKLGQTDQMSEEELEKEEKRLLSQLRSDYDRITDGVVALPRQSKFKAYGLIDTYTELVLVDQYLQLEKSEDKHFSMIERVLSEFPIYTEFLSKTRGCGPAMSAVIISEFDIHRAKYPSSLWKYAGLDVASDGKGRSRRQEHLVEVPYTNTKGEHAVRNGITFNPHLKTKLVGVLAGSFLKTNNPVYRKIYDDYKNRLENHVEHAKKSKGHRHNMALRYMVKRFLVDLYIAWRGLEGLEVYPEYSEAKLGMVHGRDPSAEGGTRNADQR